MIADTSLNGIKNPEWTCPNCKAQTFDSQRAMVSHALLCKQERANE